MAYTSIDDPTLYFNTKLYTGNGSTQSITGVGFQPDWIWFKCRSATEHHGLFDSVRGVTKAVYSNLTIAEDTLADSLASFNSDGFTMGADTGSGGAFNGNTKTMVAWNWLAGGTASSNTDGSITSSVSANQDAGFSIVSYTGTGSAGTIGHGLGTTPSMIITKSRSAGGGWYIYHKSIGATKFLQLSTTDASATNSTVWNNTEPTSSVFSTGTAFDNGTTYIAYCFAEKQGFSKFGSYTGNGSTDGTFVYTGFIPAFIMCKKSSSTGAWVIQDNKRDNSFNVHAADLNPNYSEAEESNGAVDFLSNGFKMRNTDGDNNASGQTYIYMAFAENPFVSSTGVPATAR